MIKFGVLGAAKITPRALVYPCMDEPNAFIRVIGARSHDRAASFAEHHGIPSVVSDYASVIADESINSIYIPLPISNHREWAIKALNAGKHVLCEKSFAANANEAQEMADAAKRTGLVLMDAFHYRYHPIFIRAKQIYDGGGLGAVREVNAAFHVPAAPDPSDIRMNYETAGGVTMDIGCYPISWVRHITGAEPEEVKAVAEVGPPNVDLYMTTEMRFPEDIKVTTSGDMRSSATFDASLVVTGDKGVMTVTNPLVPQMGNSIELIIDGKTSVETFSRRPTYSYQLDAFIGAVEKGGSLFTGPEDAVKQMKLIDRCYEAAGLPLRGEDQLSV
jgi:predicted dehydrogenase